MSRFPTYEFPKDLPPFQQELHVLSWFRDNFSPNPKKIGEMNLYIYPLVPKFIQENFCKTLAMTSNPGKFLQRAFKDIDAYPKVMGGLIAEGNHGMILDGSKIYGFELDTRENWLNPEKDGKWTLDQEHEIVDKALISWMAKERIRKFKGRVVLFPNFGFSGTPFNAEFRFKDDTWEQLQEIYKKEDRIKMNEELSLLLNQE